MRDGAQVNDIIVTAERRAEPLEKVPVSVQVVSGTSLVENNNNNLTDLAKTLPAVRVVTGATFGDSLAIRGIASGNHNPAFDQSVAIFDDDIYYGRSRMVQSTFLDMDRIEILKGPQTTFFGNNAVAGALNLITKKPGDTLSGYGRALYGSYGEFALEGAVGGPINDMFGFRLAGTFNGKNGWITNVNTGEIAPRERNVGARLTLVAKPSSVFEATLKVEGSINNIRGAVSELPSQWINCPPPAPIPVSGLNRQCAAALAAGVPMGFDNDLNSELGGQFARIGNHAEVLNMKLHALGLDFTSVTGYYGYRFDTQNDIGDVGNQQLLTSTGPETYHQFSQELRVATPDNRPVLLSAGIYYQADKLGITYDLNAGFVSPLLSAKLGFPASQLPLGYRLKDDQTEDVGSLFTAATWEIAPNVKLNAGIRGTAVHKAFVGQVYYGHATQVYGGIDPYPANLNTLAGLVLGPPGTFSYARTDHGLMGSAGIQYQLASTAMTYFSFSRGFKAGGFNGYNPAPLITATGVPIEQTFGPEHVNSFELGLKSKLADNRVLLNVALFREDYYGLQLNSFVQLAGFGIGTIIPTNAASARSQGVEVEGEWILAKSLRLRADMTFLDAKYTSYPNASPTYVQTTQGLALQDLSGRPLDFASRWNASATAEYRMNVGGNLRARFTATPIFQTKYYNSNGTDDPVFLIPGSTRLDAQATLESRSGKWAIDLIGKNLTDAIIVVSRGEQASLGAKQEPRNVAVQLRVNW